ncbi:MAG: hypothetical protein HW421_3423, partial [Ignavibacteria bacterium]|nr:hypothetical protein [Ignavibacteria bacterium]
MKIKYQIFVSSTYEDLIEERNAVMKAIQEMGHMPVGMELFNASDKTQWELIKNQIDDSDYYVIIAAHRYGSTDGNISYTEKEYDYAVKCGIPKIPLIIDKNVHWEPKFIDDGEKKKCLEKFKEKIKEKHCKFWKNKDDLAGKVFIGLYKAFEDFPRPGWIKNPINQVTSEINLTKLIEKGMVDAKKQLQKIKNEFIGELNKEKENIIKDSNFKNIDITKHKEISVDTKSQLSELTANIEQRKELGEKLSADDYFYQGLAFYNYKKYQIAIDLLDKVLRINPKYYDAWNNKGTALSQLGKNKEAIKCYDKAIELKSNYYE